MMAERGLQPRETVDDGELHRSDGLDEKRGECSAWYTLHSDGLPAGSFGGWRTGLCGTWCAETDRTMTGAEYQAHRQCAEQAKVDVAAEHAKVAEEATVKCAELQNIAANIDGGHAYIRHKDVKPTGAKQLHDASLIPLRGTGGELRSLQFTQPDGSRRFKMGGTVVDCYCTLGDKPRLDTPLFVCES